MRSASEMRLALRDKQKQQQTLRLPVNPHHNTSRYEHHSSERKYTLSFSKQYSAHSLRRRIPSEDLRTRHSSVLRQTPHTIPSAMNQPRQTNPGATDDALLLHNSTVGESCAGEQTASAASLLGLPVELQKNILGYVRLPHILVT
jgi:hypothetical protein